MSDDWRLVPIANPAHVTIRGVRFAMLDGTELVKILVTHAALDHMQLPSASNGDPLNRFEKHRVNLERFANDKFTRGGTEADGSITVLAGDVKA